jgi:hypothetical protein
VIVGNRKEPIIERVTGSVCVREREREREGQMMLISNIMKGQVGVDLLIECDVLADE